MYCAVLELSFQYKRLWKGARRGFKLVVVELLGIVGKCMVGGCSEVCTWF